MQMNHIEVLKMRRSIERRMAWKLTFASVLALILLIELKRGLAFGNFDWTLGVTNFLAEGATVWTLIKTVQEIKILDEAICSIKDAEANEA